MREKAVPGEMHFSPGFSFSSRFFHGDLMLSRPCVASGLIPGFPVRKRWSRLRWWCLGHTPVGAGEKFFRIIGAMSKDGKY